MRNLDFSKQLDSKAIGFKSNFEFQTFARAKNASDIVPNQARM